METRRRHLASRSTGTWRDAQQPPQSEAEAVPRGFRRVRVRRGRRQGPQSEAEAVPRGFMVQPRRWVVERTHAWNERARRLMAHHDRSNWAPVAWLWLAQTRTLATRLVT